ncbi:hydrogenase small subunit [Parabacteroides pacaensis]|uniref:hydrogenase small subunit n=1 Tax=Parabacteroides pacaensis TaxID=2086575 RepID=UPI000D1148BB|nr:hydrogenase small subunit [Parabacteroides pacaensis]
MSEKRKTVYEACRENGISRRDFLKFCTSMAALLGLQASGIAQIVNALETKPRLPVIWLHFQECTCCSESFLRLAHPDLATILFEQISLDYDETLMAAAGHQAEKSRHETMEKYKGEYLLMIEGSVPLGNPGYCVIGGESALDVLNETAAGAKAIISWGNCACSGCVQAAIPNPTDAKPIHKLIKGKPVINVQGCPPIPDVMAGVVVYLLTFDRIPQLDGLGRPLAFYSRRVHDTCYRRANFDAGLFVEAFDDENAKHGYCLYKIGCRGPSTYNSCGIIRWNEGTSYPIQSGHPCLGCSEAGFWDNGPFYQRLPDVHGFGIEATADQIGLGLGVVTAAGITAHAISTNIRKKKLIENMEEEPEEGPLENIPDPNRVNPYPPNKE